jgi:hypothetical protein
MGDGIWEMGDGRWDMGYGMGTATVSWTIQPGGRVSYVQFSISDAFFEGTKKGAFRVFICFLEGRCWKFGYGRWEMGYGGCYRLLDYPARRARLLYSIFHIRCFRRRNKKGGVPGVPLTTDMLQKVSTNSARLFEIISRS